MATALYTDKDTNDELWKECSKWLTRWGMLRADHRANWPDACIADLANILRDGVLLCKLLNKISPGCIDMKNVNLKPAMAQFLSLHNIELFLKTCVISFGLKDQDLFDPLVLFELTNFHKVLCTLSKLSLTKEAQKSNILGFTAQGVKTKEEDVIYQSLKSVYVRTNEPSWLQFTIPCPRPEDREEEVYDDLCYVTFSTCLPEQPQTFEKRDFVIKELLDTEKNYVEVLAKLKRNFMKPLANQMKPQDHEVVFYKIYDLHEIHLAFYRELTRFRDPGFRLSSIFMNWRERFLVYGGYCANLTRATNLLQELCDCDENFNATIVAYEKEDNNGRFKLRDVLSVPMQRILKYHLLLEKLIENTDPNDEECNDLRRAREAMLDVAGFINEAARDSEHLAVIQNLQENIVEWYRSPDHRLVNYGRLIKDGEMKIKAHDDQKIRNRYVFIFDKCILICKQIKVRQFAFRNIINISEYHVDDTHNRAVLSRDARFCYHFHLVKNDNVMVYTIFVRTLELKQQMIKAINDALDNIHPAAIKRTNHTFELQTFNGPVQCFHCSKYLRGLIYQGYKCGVCGIGVHKHCIAHSGRCGSHNHHSTSDLVMNGADACLRDKLWFVGEMDRSRAQNELERRENGTFLVRIRPQSEDKDKYALSLKTNDTVKHMKICSTGEHEGKYYLSLSKFFSNIEELVLNYQTNSLKENFERLEENTKLLWPYRQLLATVIRNFEPTEICHLPLREGQIIYVIGKEGYREGWWKGRNDRQESGFFPSNAVRIDGEARLNTSRHFTQ
ncbi:protein vav isoform X1 [Tribolium castaneum]|uniref:protein vav isoform X1 n=1 Tax=Tribolium castaneum TaxID=7070 RepID=UPI0001758844|nr:PREDICTED: protein vav isoform X1 [Tribolium castaneum]|eukprot:XP_015839689.1 PREDICTED: protein vav isoform X1 [Tribolium castaneum]